MHTKCYIFVTFPVDTGGSLIYNEYTINVGDFAQWH